MCDGLIILMCEKCHKHGCDHRNVLYECNIYTISNPDETDTIWD